MKHFILKILLAFSTFLIIGNCFGQEIELPKVTIPQLPKTGINIQDFVPNGWAVELSESGDLGGDRSKRDYLLLLKMQDRHNILHDYANCHDPLDTNPRLLVFLLARNGRYFLAGQNSELIPRPDSFCSGDDPIDGITGGDIQINNKKGIVNLGFWGGILGHQSFHFQWRNQGVYLVACNKYTRQRASGGTSNIEADYIKRQVRYEDVELHENNEKDSYEEVTTRDETQSISSTPLIRLEDMDVFYNFNCATMRNYR